MSGRHKYPFNNVCFFENAREHIERDDFSEIPIGKIGGVDGWYFTIQQRIISDEVRYYPFISTDEEKTMFKYRVYSNILKNDGLSEISLEHSGFLKHDFGVFGKRITVEKYLNEENGYLTNGGLKVEYGLQIEGILSPDDIWTFNFHDRLFECQEKQNIISFYKNGKNGGIKFFHCHKQLLTYHSTYFNSDSKENQMIKLTVKNPTCFNEFLQLSHGVRDDLRRYTFYHALKYAQRYKLFNVIHLIDQFIVSNSWDLEEYLPQAVSYDLKHFLADFLKEQKTSKKLAEKLKKVNLEKISGGAMKKCVKRFFEF